MDHKKAIEIFKTNIIYVTICEKKDYTYTQDDCMPLIHIPSVDFTDISNCIKKTTLKMVFSCALEMLSDTISYNSYYIQWSRDAPGDLRKYFISTGMIHKWIDALKIIASMFAGISRAKSFYENKVNMLSRMTSKAVNVSTMRSVESEVEFFKRKLEQELQKEQETITTIYDIIVSEKINEMFERMNYAICFEEDPSTYRTWCFKHYPSNASKIEYLEMCLDKSNTFTVYIDDTCTSCSSVCDEEIHMWIQLLKK